MKIKLLVLFGYLTLILNVQLFSQTTITIGSSTNSNSNTAYPAPYGNYYWGAKHQLLIRASELLAAGAYSGNIQSLAFNVLSANNIPLQNFSIKIKSTTVNSLTSFETGATTVYNNTYTETNGWNTHVFSSPFYWDGTSNIIIETCFNNSSYTNNARVYYTNTAFLSVVYANQDVGGVCSVANGSTSNRRPNMRFVFSPTTSPPAPKFTANTTNTCSGLVSFTDQSIPTPTSWKWYFGDGDSSSLQNPTHQYTNSGQYSVTLTASNQYGDSSVTKTNYITANINSVPIPVSCTPQTLDGTAGFGITKFVFNTLTCNSANASEGYLDTVCLGTNVFAGAEYTISAITNTPTAHNIRVWIDFNNDGVLHNTNELVYSADSVLTTTGTVRIPDYPTLNTPLRLRVSADYALSSIPTPCNNLQYGQAEDYTVVVFVNPNKPAANFVANKIFTCDGTVSFLDNSANVPYQWLWDFGDGNYSVQKNPTHIYSVSGNYSVKLIATNSNGSDSLIIQDYITVNLENDVTPASCIPQTLNYCCNYGILNVSLNGMSVASQNASEGYKDFSCDKVTTVIEGNTYPITIKTGGINEHDTRVWIDFDDNGAFDSNEMVFEKLSTFNPSGDIYIPLEKTYNKTLRMRIISDFAGSDPLSCSNPLYGQAEDYGLIIQEINKNPIASYTVDKQFSCDGVVNFSNNSINGVSWEWDFGDGQTSQLLNPSYTYTTSGSYDASLTVTNTFGMDVYTSTIVVDFEAICDTVYLPLAGTGPIQTSCNGLLIDKGGIGNYPNNNSGTITIAPTNATSVSLTFTEFELEQGADFLILYDGSNVFSPVLGNYSGTSLLNQTITSSSGALTLQFYSNTSVNFAGFFAEWSCIVGLNDFVKNDLLEVSPNPANKTIHINFTNSFEGNVRLIITDLIGKVVVSEEYGTEVKNKEINVEKLDEGIYVMNIFKNGFIYSEKIIVKH